MVTNPGITADQLRIWRERARLGELTSIEEARQAILAIRKDFLSAPVAKAAKAAKSDKPDASLDF